MSPAPRVLDLTTPVGTARAHIHDTRAHRLRGTVVLGHGAGGGVEARDLVALAAELPRDGHRVVLVEQPWRVEGKRVAAAPARLDVAWCAVIQELRERGQLAGAHLVVGGRSAGARVACRTALSTGASAAVLLAFPLHPPGRPDRDRSDEAKAAGVPLVVVQGERDGFGGAEELRRALPGTSVRAVPCADHGMATPKSAPITQGEALELIVAAVRGALAEWESGGWR